MRMKQDEELDVFSTPFVDFHNTVDEAAFFFSLSASNSWTTAEKVVGTCVGCNSLVKADHTVARTRFSLASCTVSGQTSLMSSMKAKVRKEDEDRTRGSVYV